MRNQGMEYNESKPKSREFYLFIHRLLGFRKSEFAISKDSLLKRIIRKIKRLLHFKNYD